MRRRRGAKEEKVWGGGSGVWRSRMGGKEEEGWEGGMEGDI